MNAQSPTCLLRSLPQWGSTILVTQTLQGRTKRPLKFGKKRTNAGPELSNPSTKLSNLEEINNMERKIVSKNSILNGARGRNRTTDTRIFNPLLYP